MADKKISALPASSTPLAGTEVLPIVQSGSTVQVSVANLTAGRVVDATASTMSGVTTASGLKGSYITGTASNNTVNSQTYAVTFNTSAKVFAVACGNGDAVLVVACYTSSTITILGAQGGNVIVASSTPGASELGIYKNANDHVIYFKTGSALDVTAGSWTLQSLTTVIS